MVYGIRYTVYGIWYMVYGIWYMVYGIWYMVYGIWYMVYGTWYMVHGICICICIWICTTLTENYIRLCFKSSYRNDIRIFLHRTWFQCHLVHLGNPKQSTPVKQYESYLEMWHVTWDDVMFDISTFSISCLSCAFRRICTRFEYFTPELIAILSHQAEESETTNSGWIIVTPPRDIRHNGT